MATLTNADFTDIKNRIQRDPTGRDQFRSWPLTKAQFMAAFQAAEDWFVTGFTTRPALSFKAAIEVETGDTTNAQTKLIGVAWMGWRFQANP